MGKGSTVFFTAGFVLPDDAIETSTVGDVPEIRGLPVLIAEDHTTSRTILEEIVQSWHMEATGVADRVSALAAMKKAADAGEPFHFAIIDAELPGQDGVLIWSREIQKEPRLRATPVILLTSAGRRIRSGRAAQIGSVRLPVQTRQTIRVAERDPCSSSPANRGAGAGNRNASGRLS